jgi:heat shock protein 4
MPVLGIDFGSKACVIAIAKRGGVSCILNENSKRKTASLVTFNDKQRFFGVQAEPLARSQYKNTVQYIQRVVGLKWSDPYCQEELNYMANKDRWCEDPETGECACKLTLNGETKIYSATKITAMLLGSMMSTAEKGGAKGRADVVVTIPGWFTDAQRRAMLDACKIANINVLKLVNESTSTALNYGIWKSAKGEFTDKPVHVMFVDLGESSFTATVVAFVKGRLKVLASQFDKSCGGRLITHALKDKFAEDFLAKYKADPRTNQKAVIKLLKACEKTKTTLTPIGVPKGNCNVECLMNDRDFRGEIKVDELEEIATPLMQRCCAVVQAVLDETGLTSDQLSSVEIVGGASRMPCVKRSIAELLQLDTSKHNFGLMCTMNADEATACGASLQCAMLSPLFQVKEFSVSDVVQYPIRLTWEQIDTTAAVDEEGDVAMDGEGTENTVVLFPKNDEVPKTKRVTFRRGNAFELVATYDASCADRLPQGQGLDVCKFAISGMPETDEESGELPRIRVHIRHDINGVLDIASAEYMKQKPEEKEPEKKKEEDAAATEGDKDKDAGKDKDVDMTAADAEKTEATDESTTAAADGNGEDAATAAAATEAAAAEAAKPKKKKFKKVSLLATVVGASGMNKQQLMEAEEDEAKLRQADRLVQQTADARNELESFIYEMRDKISGPLRDFGTDEERASIGEQLQTSEDWLYTDEGFDSTKSVYTTKLGDLRAVCAPIENRNNEYNERPKAVKALSVSIEQYRKTANSTEEKYDHLDQTDRDAIRSACSEAEGWMHEQQEAQGALPLCADPVLTTKLLYAKQSDLFKTCHPIATKKKPEPKKEEPKADATEGKEGEAATADNATAEGDAAAKTDEKKEDDPMESDDIEVD